MLLLFVFYRAQVSMSFRQWSNLFLPIKMNGNLASSLIKNNFLPIIDRPLFRALVTTHIRTVFGPYFPYLDRCRTVADVVYLAGNFCFANRKKFCFLNFQLCFADKNFKQPNCF
jgi:hypothetical protein